MASSTTYHPGGLIPAAVQQNRAELFDGTAGTYTAWDKNGVQTATRPLATAEAAALAATDTALAAGVTLTGLTTSAQQALAANTAYLAITLPTIVQTGAQVAQLTTQYTTILKLILSRKST